MELNKLVEQFLAEHPKNKDVAKYFVIASNIGFNQAIDISYSLVQDCGVPDAYSQPVVDDLAEEILNLKRDI